tara:strand:- start:4376 stop:4576 length:201 start_codon:yes stop_codon:yes gene_type:complete
MIKKGSLVRVSYYYHEHVTLGIVVGDTTEDYSTSEPRCLVHWFYNGETKEMLEKYVAVVSEPPDDN